MIRKIIALIICIMMLSVLSLTSCEALDGIFGDKPDTGEGEGNETDPPATEKTEEEKLAEYLSGLDLGDLIDDAEETVIPDLGELLADRKMQFDLKGSVDTETGGGARLVVADGVLYMLALDPAGDATLSALGWFGDDMLYTMTANGSDAVEGVLAVESTGLRELLGDQVTDVPPSQMGQLGDLLGDIEFDEIKASDITAGESGKYAINPEYVKNNLQKAVIEMLGGNDIGEEVKTKIGSIVEKINLSVALTYTSGELLGMRICIGIDEEFVAEAEELLGGALGVTEAEITLDISGADKANFETESRVLLDVSVSMSDGSSVSATADIACSYSADRELIYSKIKVLSDMTGASVNGSAEKYYVKIDGELELDVRNVYVKSADVLTAALTVTAEAEGVSEELVSLSAFLKNDADGCGIASLEVKADGTDMSLSGKAYYDSIPNPPSLSARIDKIAKNISLISDAAESVGQAICSASDPFLDDAYIYLTTQNLTLHVYPTVEDNVYEDDRIFLKYYIYEGKEIAYGDMMRGYTEYTFDYSVKVLNRRDDVGEAKRIAEELASLLDESDCDYMREYGRYRSEVFYYPLGRQNASGDCEYVALKFTERYGNIELSDSYFVDGMEVDRSTAYYTIDFDDDAHSGVTVSYVDCYYNRLGKEIAAFVTNEHFPPNQTNYVNLYYVLDEYDDMGDPVYLEITVLRNTETGEIFKSSGYALKNIEYLDDEGISVVNFTDDTHSGITVETVDKPLTTAERLRDEIVALIDAEDMAQISTTYGSYWYYDTGVLNAEGHHRMVRLSMYLVNGEPVCNDVYGGYMPVIYSEWLFVRFDDSEHSGITVAEGAFDGGME